MASIQRRANGKWRARYRDEAGTERARHFTKKVTAQRWLDEVTASLVTGSYVDPSAGRMTFDAFYAEWSARQVWAPATHTAMALAVRSTPFRSTQLHAIRRTHVQQWVRAMSSELAPGTVHTRVNNVRAVLRAAVTDQLIATDPSAGVSLPRRRKVEHSMTLPTSSQLAALLAAADTGFVPFVALGAFAGLRLGEAAAVRVDDVDFLRRTLTVSRQVQRAGGGQVEIRLPKHGSERTVYLPERLVTMLSQHVAGLGSEWLFTGDRDQPPHQNTISYWWRKTLRDAGVAGLRLHDLRHYYASGLIAQGCDVVTVQRALGHSSASTTLSTYSHLWPSAEEKTRSAVAELMAEVELDADCVRTEQVR